ncbi:MAG: PorV/PorQ family protein [bacterium]
MTRTLKSRRILTAWVLAVGIIFCQSPVFAQDAGGVESPFDLGGSARTLGMGGVGVAFTGDGNSFFLNPATLASVTEQQILTFHSPLLLDSAYDALGYVLPLGAHVAMGAAVERVSTTGVLETVDSISPVGTISNEQLQGLLGYGFQLDGGLSLGVNLKYDHQALGSYQDSGLGLDMGLLYQFARTGKDLSRFGLGNLSLGFSVSNLVPSGGHLFEIDDDPARVLRPGLSYHYQTADLSTSIWLGVEGEFSEDANSLLLAGLEYGWNNLLFGRVGFDGVGPTAGAGIRWEGLEFDYAFNQRDLGPLQRFSLTFRFDPYRVPLDNQKMDTMKFIAKTYERENEYDAAIQAWKSEQSQFPDDPDASGAIHDLQERRQKAVQADIIEGRAALAANDLDRAIRALAQGLSLDPTNPEIKRTLGGVNRQLVLTADYMRGTEAYSREDFKTAVRYLGVVYQLDPNYRSVGFLYRDSQSHYMPLESMPKNVTDHYALGVSAYMAGNYSKAVTEWKKVLAEEPKNYLVRRNIEEAQRQLDAKSSPAAIDDGKGSKN